MNSVNLYPELNPDKHGFYPGYKSQVSLESLKAICGLKIWKD